MYSGNIAEDFPEHETLSTLWRGRIARSAQDADDFVEVIIPAFDNQQRFGPARWVSRATDQSYTSPDTAWHDIGTAGNPSFGTGFQNYGAFSGDHAYNDAGFRKIASGMVLLKGLVTVNATGTIFTLPVGYRPAKRVLASGQGSTGGMPRVDVASDGVVSLQTGLPANGWVSLEQIHFWVGPDLSLTFNNELPLRGDECIVTFDEQNRPYVVGWWPA